MQRCFAPVLSVVLTGFSVGVAQQPSIPTFVIKRPTVIAFFEHVSDSDLEKNPDTNETLSDFQLYVSRVGPRLKELGIDFEVANSATFRVKDGGKVRPFEAGNVGVGYYFVAPGKFPKVQYGVMTDDDIVEAGKKYFHLPIAAR